MLRITKKAFSIGEVLIAMFVLTVGLGAVTTLMTSNLRSTIDSRNKIIASELAQEGIELVRNVRDNNWIQGETCPYKYLVYGGVCDNTSQRRCIVENKKSYGDSDFIYCGALGTTMNQGISSTYTVCYDSVNKLFYQEPGCDSTYKTKFARKIITYLDNGNLIVKSFVSWGAPYANGGTFPSDDDDNDCNSPNKCVSAQSVLTNWAGN